MRWPAWVRFTRQNHAVEHATIHLLARSHPGIRLMGRSDWKGFWLYGEVGSADLRWAIEEALRRLAGQEPGLAIHPRCGTNLAAGGLLMLGATYAACTVPGRSRLQRIAMGLLGIAAGLFGARSLGRIVQKRVTTNPDVQDVYVRDLRRERRGELLVHRVLLGRWE